MSNVSSPYSFSSEPAWYSYRNQGDYAGGLPAFYESSEFEWVKQTELQFDSLREKVTAYLQEHRNEIQPYFSEAMVTLPNSWKTQPFFFWGQRMREPCTHAPALEKFFNTIPGMLSASISILDAHTEIKPHCGDTNTVIRCHLGLSIPAGLPDCGFEVNGLQRAWEEGKWLLFTDAHRHRAWNKTDRTRVLIIVDVLSPHYKKHKQEICFNVLSALKVQQLDQRMSWVKQLPGLIRGMIRRVYKFGFRFKILKWS